MSALAFDRLQPRVHFARGRHVGAVAQLFHHREDGLGRLVEQLQMFLKIAAVQIARTNQNAFADFLDRLRNFVERSGERLDVFALQRRDESLAKLLGQLLRDLLVLAPAVDELLQTLRRIVLLQFREEIDEVMHAAIGLLRARLQEVVKFFVVSEQFLDREHGWFRFCG